MNDAQLRSAVTAIFTAPATVLDVRRRRSEYATSFSLDEVIVTLASGHDVPLIFKDLAWHSLLTEARNTKPMFLYEPQRERRVYERILPYVAAGPARCYAAGDSWLLLEKVAGAELYQVAELEAWERTARWFAAMHQIVPVDHFDDVPLIRFDGDYLRCWMDRASTFRSDRRLTWLAWRYDDVVEQLTAMPAAFIHGEAYASNVLVAPGRVCPIDWEMAGRGPALIDLAALVTGQAWTELERTMMVRAYLGREPDATVLAALDACRLHLAIQWLGWSASWAPPAEHAHDWVGEATELAERLGL